MSAGTILLAGGGTGGHVFPLLSVADALSALAPEVELCFIGTERGMEVKLVPERGYKLELVRVVPIRGGGIAGAVRGAWRALWSIPESRSLLRRYSPRGGNALTGNGGWAGGGTGCSAMSCWRWAMAASSWASSPRKVACGRLSTTMSGSTPCPSISHSPSGL